jgi:hypothetical protein
MAMGPVFVSYKREDAGRARLIVEGLRAEGFQVWWDQGIGSGESWRAEINQHLAAASAVCVLWSEHSVGSEWVVEEAQRGKDRRILCPALIDDVALPIGFGGTQTSNLMGWSGDRRDPAWRHYVESVNAILSGRRAPERKPPRPRAKASSVAIGALGVVAAVVTILAGAQQFGLVHLVTTDRNGASHLILPSDQATWARVRAGHDCSVIRAYLSSNPNGPFAVEAQALLAARTERQVESWAPYAQPSLVTGTSSIDQRQTEELACQSARESAQRNARSGCDIYGSDSAHFRNMTPVLAELTCDCADRAIRFEGPGADQIQPIWHCSVRSSYQCRGEMRERRAQEYCGGE